MPFAAYPRLSPTPGTAQVQLVDFAARQARAPRFFLDGAAANARPLRAMQSARVPEDGVPVASVSPRAFTGVYQFEGLDAGRQHVLDVVMDADRQRLSIGALPSTIPSEAGGGFDILLASCFCVSEHNPATLQAALNALLSGLRPKPNLGRRPDCSFLMGDQVYLDLPSLTNFPPDRPRLAPKFETDYVRNWQRTLSPLLGTAPSVCLPDDHEFWNNAPHVSPFIQNSWNAEGRRQWRGSAQAMFDAFARPYPFQGNPGDTPFVVTVRPVSFFLADGRSGRTEQDFLTGPCRQELVRWVRKLNDEKLVGVFATGQSLFRDPQGKVAGAVADKELPNYRDYAEVVATLQQAQLPLFALTGDVHWGRLTAARDGANRPRVNEVIVSPLSLVTTPGSDQVHTAWNWAKGVFGTADPLPRHSDADPAPQQFGAGAGRLSTQVLKNLKGDQLALLSFTFDASRQRLTVSVTYYFVHDRPPPPVTVRLLDASIAA